MKTLEAVDRKEVPSTEYIGKTTKEIKELAKDMAQFRIVVISGAILSEWQRQWTSATMKL